MSRLRDVEIRPRGLAPKEFRILLSVNRKQNRYPFRRMGPGDFFRLETAHDAACARSAATQYSSRNLATKFTVRLDQTGSVWICRRIR